MQKTAEAVSLGHPDKTADYISSYILDRLIEQDPQVKYAVEVLIKDNNVVLGGEVTTSAPLGDLTAYVKAALAEIGYDYRYVSIWGDLAINPAQTKVTNLIGVQSADINAWGWVFVKRNSKTTTGFMLSSRYGSGQEVSLRARWQVSGLCA